MEPRAESQDEKRMKEERSIRSAATVKTLQQGKGSERMRRETPGRKRKRGKTASWSCKVRWIGIIAGDWDYNFKD